MAFGGFNQNFIQFGKETTPGTVVPTTEVWMGNAAMGEDNTSRELIEQQVGTFVAVEEEYTSWESAEVSIPSSAMSYEQAGHIWQASIENAAGTGAGPYTYDWSYDINAPKTISTYTMETGNAVITSDNQQIPFCAVTSWSMSGAVKQPWNMESTWMGQRMVPAVRTAALPLLDVERVSFNNTQLFIDPSGGTVGATQITAAVLMGAEINCTDTGVREVPAATGNNYLTAIKQVSSEITYSLTFELENDIDAVAGARATFKANTPVLYQLLIPGTGGRSMRLRFAGKYNKIGGYDNANGNVTVTIGGRVTYNSTDNLYFESQIINNRATL